MKRYRWVLIVGQLGLLLACGRDDSPEPAADATVSPGQTVDDRGGTVLGPSGCSVEIPAGALTAPTTITIEIVADGYPSFHEGTPRSPVFALRPHGLTFAKPVRLRVPFSGVASASVALYTTPPAG